MPSHHRLVTLPDDDALRLGQPYLPYDATFVDAVPAESLPRPTWESVSRMPSETYDNTWVEAGGPTATSEFVTSDQCLGCHDAGGTGLQYDMTEPDPQNGSQLLNLSPYATWRSSPMGLGGRDPIFYAMLASETETFHPDVLARDPEHLPRLPRHHRSAAVRHRHLLRGRRGRRRVQELPPRVR